MFILHHDRLFKASTTNISINILEMANGAKTTWDGMFIFGDSFRASFASVIRHEIQLY